MLSHKFYVILLIQMHHHIVLLQYKFLFHEFARSVENIDKTEVFNVKYCKYYYICGFDKINIFHNHPLNNIYS